MIHERSNEGRVIDLDWHEFRRIARRTAFSPEEFSEQERERYNLDDDDPLSARITGEENPDTYSGVSSEDIDPLPVSPRSEDPIR